MDDLTESIIGFDALYFSMLNCKKSVVWKNSVARFYLNGIEETLKLERQLKDGTYKARPPKQFIITYPKKREAVSIHFRDRVYQRSLNDNVLYPTMTKSFVYQNMACQKGKGTDLARNTLDKYLRKAFRKWDYNCYILQCDVKSYYPSMSHEVAEHMFKEHLPDVAYEMAEKILRGQYPGDVGYNPGSQMIQIAGISVLDPLDHFIKEQLHIKLYLRYMDDFALIHPDRKYLEWCRQRIDLYLSDLRFQLHPEKTKIYPIRDGVTMLGFTHKVSPTGKVIRIIDPERVKAYRRKLRKLVSLAKKGKITRRKVDRCYNSWKAHAQKGNSFKLLQRMDQYYGGLWNDD